MTNKPSQPPANPPVNFVDNPHAPDVFADSVTGVFFFGGNLRLTFESYRVNHVTTPGPVNRVVIGRLILPMQAAKGLRDLLNDYLKKYESEGGTPPPQESAPTSVLH